MAIDKTVGIVLRAVDFSETSKVVTFFTRDLGKLGALAKGGRRLKGSFDVALDLLTVCSICVLRKPRADLDLLTEASLDERFVGLRSELLRLYAGFYLAEVLDGMTQVGDPHPSLFDQSVAALRRLAAGEPVKETLSRFQLEMLSELGLAPRIDSCVGCGRKASRPARKAFSYRAGGLVCDRCRGDETTIEWISGAAVLAMQAWQRKVDPGPLATKVAGETWRITRKIVEYQWGRPSRTGALIGD